MSDRRTKRKQASRGSPCPVCEASHGCSVGEDGLILCRRRQGQQTGFACLGPAKGDDSWTCYRPASTNGISPPPSPHQHKQPRLTAGKNDNHSAEHISWPTRAATHAAELTPERKIALSRHLGLPLECLDLLPRIGSCKTSRDGMCWTFPEMNGEEEIVGIVRRRADGMKRAIQGSTRGLSVHTNWEEVEGPVYVVEGPSDVLALGAMGLAGIGRPSNRAGTRDLATLFARVPANRSIVVMAEWDANGDGSWPGLDGAKHISAELARLLNRPIFWALPPDQAKDVRRWAHMHLSDPVDSPRWDLIGKQFRELLVLNTVEPPKEPEEEDGLVTRTFDQIEPDVTTWLVPGYIPEGELVLFAGPGGQGKSFITIHIAARLSRGLPVFDLAYTPEGPRSVLLMACEDHAEKTQKPRVMAADANGSMIHFVEGIKTKAGKFAPFSLNHIDAIERKLAKLKDCALVIIDPVTAFLAGTNKNPGKDEEVRELLEPLRIVARTHNCSVMLVKHFNKSNGPVARNRIADAAGWVNACRAAYLVLKSRESENDKFFICDKMNAGPIPMGLIYRVSKPHEDRVKAIAGTLPAKWSQSKRQDFLAQLALAEWIGETDEDSDSICMRESAEAITPPGVLQQASDWMRRYLLNGPAEPESVAAAGNLEMGFTRSVRWWRDQILKGILQGQSKKTAKFQGNWCWCLKGQEPPAEASE